MPKAPFDLNRRASGILLHPTSLPGPHGSGDIGPAARRFVRFLADAGQSWWQMLPVGPPGPGNSPYSGFSAFAGSPLLVSLDMLAADGLLGRGDLRPPAGMDRKRVAYGKVRRFRDSQLRRAFRAFTSRRDALREAYDAFCANEGTWLDDYALFQSLRDVHGGRLWTSWPRPLRRRDPAELRSARRRLAEQVDYHRFVQFAFARQWARLRAECAEAEVGLIGDVPIFVAHDSSDVWAHQELFLLDRDGRTKVVSGVPPDFFNADGQKWGHPLYTWRRHSATGFSWWIERMRAAHRMFDAVRIDHFLGFHRCWAVPAGAKTARRGTWIATPGDALLGAIRSAVPGAQIIAEDLGLVTAEATALRDRFRLPGMRVLLCGFGDDGDGSRFHLPHRYPRHCVAYTGTHDFATTVEWYRALTTPGAGKAARAAERRRALSYVGGDGRDVHHAMIRALLASPADVVVIPMQDMLGLGADARMNRPGTARGNWEWRVDARALTSRVARRLRSLCAATERLRHIAARDS